MSVMQRISDMATLAVENGFWPEAVSLNGITMTHLSYEMTASARYITTYPHLAGNHIKSIYLQHGPIQVIARPPLDELDIELHNGKGDSFSTEWQRIQDERAFNAALQKVLDAEADTI